MEWVDHSKLTHHKRPSAGRPSLMMRASRVPVFGTTTWRTYSELSEMVTQFGAGLRHLGAQPQPSDVATNDHSGVLIYDETSADWMVAALGAFSQDICVATSYATLGTDSVVKAVKQGGVTVLICNRKALPEVARLPFSHLRKGTF